MEEWRKGVVSGNTIINASMLNSAGAIVPDAYQQIVGLIFEESAARQGMEISHMIRYLGVSWVMLAMTLEIKSPALPGETLSWSSWQSGRDGKVWRRETELLHADGTPAIYGATFVSLLDILTRRICRDEKTLDRLNFPEGKKLIKEASSRAEYDLDAFHEQHIRKVYPSWIDELGHTNNHRYGEMGYDALSEEKRLSLMPDLSRLELYFFKELKLGESVSVRAQESDVQAQVLGVSTTDLKPSFLVRYAFDPGLSQRFPGEAHSILPGT